MRRLIVLALVCSLFLVACKRDEEQTQARLVRTITIDGPESALSHAVTGQIAARHYVNASFRISGKIAARYVTAGDRIEKGQLLAVLDDTVTKDELTQAKAQLFAAKATLTQITLRAARVSALIKSNAVSQNEYDLVIRQKKESEASVDAHEAKYHSVEEKLGYTRLYADVSGVVVSRLAESGEVVSAGQPIFKIAEDGALDAVFDLSGELVDAGIGKSVTMGVCLDRKSNICVKGEIYEVAPEADPVTRTYRAKAALENPTADMLLGAVVKGTFVFSSKDRLVRIPASALSSQNGKPVVWLVRKDASGESVAEPQSVESAGYEKNWVVVKKGLKQGDVVVTAGVHLLLPNQKVRLEEGASRGN